MHIATEFCDVGSYEAKSQFNNSTPPRSELQLPGDDPNAHTYTATLNWHLDGVTYSGYVVPNGFTATHSKSFEFSSYQDDSSLHDLVTNNTKISSGPSVMGAISRKYVDQHEYDWFYNYATGTYLEYIKKIDAL